MANHDLLFLHHGESPGAVLVSQPLFGEKPKLGSVNPKSFASNNKLGFIDGTLILNSPLVKIPSAIQAWIHSNKTVGTWIINSVSPRIILFN
uniref:Uncharacterized protein n=1 Tax=Quercus lobata TaxID=97700 RepID=A0A7N2N0Q5_QUELO